MSSNSRQHAANLAVAIITLIVPIAVLLTVPPAWPRWLFMWLLAVAVFASCKLITWNFARMQTSPSWRQWAYLFAWPGMDASRFLDATSKPQPPTAGEWYSGLLQMILGVIIFWSAARLIPANSILGLAWSGMIGIALMLHFGSFKLLSCAWRSAGVDARPLMVAPLRSTSVSEFWGKRWNTAFRDIAFKFLFRPLARRFNPAVALLLAFCFSGLVHDLVISIPARGGYGRPTLFFLIQALAMNFEKSRVGRRLRLGHGPRGWLFTAIALLAPAPLLFHEPFLKVVVVPFMTALSAT